MNVLNAIELYNKNYKLYIIFFTIIKKNKKNRDKYIMPTLIKRNLN